MELRKCCRIFVRHMKQFQNLHLQLESVNIAAKEGKESFWYYQSCDVANIFCRTVLLWRSWYGNGVENRDERRGEWKIIELGDLSSLSVNKEATGLKLSFKSKFTQMAPCKICLHLQQNYHQRSIYQIQKRGIVCWKERNKENKIVYDEQTGIRKCPKDMIMLVMTRTYPSLKGKMTDELEEDFLADRQTEKKKWVQKQEKNWLHNLKRVAKAWTLHSHTQLVATAIPITWNQKAPQEWVNMSGQVWLVQELLQQLVNTYWPLPEGKVLQVPTTAYYSRCLNWGGQC